MNIQDREQEALTAYLRLLQSKGAGAEGLVQRKALLHVLMSMLAGQPQDGALYRELVEQALQKMEKGLWPAFLALAREYYYFWNQDIKAIAAMHSNGGYDAAAPLAGPADVENLRALWNGLDREQFGVAETWPLKAYASALREEGADKVVVETRCKLVKLLLVRLRDAAEKDAGRYRCTVDSTVPLFEMKETRQLFLIVMREFFYFWIGDPEAAGHIVLDVAQPVA